jgi:hypothetical protein
MSDITLLNMILMHKRTWIFVFKKEATSRCSADCRCALACLLFALDPHFHNDIDQEWGAACVVFVGGGTSSAAFLR